MSAFLLWCTLEISGVCGGQGDTREHMEIHKELGKYTGSMGNKRGYWGIHKSGEKHMRCKS